MHCDKFQSKKKKFKIENEPREIFYSLSICIDANVCIKKDYYLCVDCILMLIV